MRRFKENNDLILHYEGFAKKEEKERGGRGGEGKIRRNKNRNLTPIRRRVSGGNVNSAEQTPAGLESRVSVTWRGQRHIWFRMRHEWGRGAS